MEVLCFQVLHIDFGLVVIFVNVIIHVCGFRIQVEITRVIVLTWALSFIHVSRPNAQ